MDVYLPDGNGLDVVRSLLDEVDPPDVIVISAAREVTSVRVAMQLGAVHYLVKPFDVRVLADRLVAYKRMRRHLATLPGEPGQQDVDELFRLGRVDDPTSTRPPKGHSAPTLELVRNAVQDADIGGAAKVAATRYLAASETGDAQALLREALSEINAFYAAVRAEAQRRQADDEEDVEEILLLLS